VGPPLIDEPPTELAKEGNALPAETFAGELFPLPLSPFERYMIADDSNDYPMAFVLTVILKGRLQRDVFQQSVLFALKRHPLLMSRISQVRSHGWCWLPVVEPTPQIVWDDSGSPLKPPDRERIDLAQQIGLRIWVNWNPHESHLVFQFHHACTDGLGGVQFIGDLLASYGQRTALPGDECPELEPIQIHRLLSRATFSTVEPATLTKKHSCPVMLAKRLIKLVCRQPVPLATARTRKSKGTFLEFPATISRVIERPLLQTLKVFAASHGVSLNDLYLLGMFQTIREWNRRYGSGHDDQWLRIGMPTSLRTPDHDQMPAANVVSYMFLTRLAKACGRPLELLADIHRQTSAIVNERQGRFVATGLKYVTKFPRFLWCLLRFNRCFTSVILSNVGDIRRQFTARFPLKQGRCVVGNVTLEALTGAVPIRRNTRLSTSMGTYAGKLYINLHCDPQSFTREQAEEISDLFVDCLKQQLFVNTTAERRTA
jgi:hypothetical protein